MRTRLIPVSLSILAILVSIHPDTISTPGRFWESLRYTAGNIDDPLAARSSWEDKDAHYYRSSHSPGILLRMKSSSIRFFANLRRYGAEPPRFFVVKTATGAKALVQGESIRGSKMTASWIVSSFQGSRGWEQFDAPWFIALEKRPIQIALTGDGLRIDFQQADTGYIFSMPLYGYYKPPQEGNDFAARHQSPSPGVEPWKWRTKVPDRVVELCDWWAGKSKAYPVGFQESFSVNPGTDEITFRQDYRWLLVKDDWGTVPKRFATLSPSLGLAWRFPGFPMRISSPIHDPGYFTASGPYVGALDVDRLEISMKLLQYTHEQEWLEVPSRLEEHHKQALNLIVGGMENKFRSPWQYFYDHGSRENLCWNLVGDVWYPRGLPFVKGSLKERAKAAMRIYLDNDVLRPHSPYHGKYILHGPGIGSWGEWGDAGKIMTDSLQVICAYAQFTGDWDLIRERWSLIKKFFITPEETDWLSFGRKTIAEIGDEAAPCSAYARMAWGVKDLDEYLFGIYMFARELVPLYIKQRAGSYFYENQPYNQNDPMPPQIYPTDIWGSTRGWQVDGPVWGFLDSGEHQSANRWVRFHDPDVGRFYRDHLAEDVQRELSWYTKAGRESRADVYRVNHYKEWLLKDSPHMLPSLVRLQSFLLGLPHQQLEGASDMSRYRSGWGAADIAVGYSLLRAMVPIRFKRLVSSQLSPSPFLLGLQRRGLEDRLTTVQDIWEEGIAIEPRWHGWNMPVNPEGGRDGAHRSFGSIEGSFGGKVSGAEGKRWVSYGCIVHWANTVAPRNLADPATILSSQDQTEVDVIGPFPNRNDIELTDVAYPPESIIDLNASYAGAYGPVSWRLARLSKGRRLDLARELSGSGGEDLGTLAYALQFVWSPEEMDVYLMAQHQGGILGWINDTPVLRYHGAHRTSRENAARELGRLKRGWNKILLKVESFTGDYTFQFRLVHLDRQPIPGLKFSYRIMGVTESDGIEHGFEASTRSSSKRIRVNPLNQSKAVSH